MGNSNDDPRRVGDTGTSCVNLSGQPGQPGQPGTRDWLRASIESLLHRSALPVTIQLPELVERLVTLFRCTMSCEHRVVPCSGLHDEGERVLICNSELMQLQEAALAWKQDGWKLAQKYGTRVWCEHFQVNQNYIKETWDFISSPLTPTDRWQVCPLCTAPRPNV